jgi:N6-L-threonylcarbamoyladenine synthase
MNMRPMTISDIPSVVEMERESFDDPWSESLFQDELRRDDRAWLVAVASDGRLLGYGGVMVTHGDAHLMDLAVGQGSRRTGLGRGLLWSLAEKAVALGAHRMTLEVAASNTAAVDLYASCGFDIRGRRRGYYPRSGDDALLMWSRPLAPHLHAMRAAAGGSDLVLAIESSCDETAASVMRGGAEQLSNVVASQVDFHARFGGVVPEIASRKHTEAVAGVVDQALEAAGVGLSDCHAVAVTVGPGLVGALVVGVAYAKGLAYTAGLPLVGVNHLEGHIYAARLLDPELEPPMVALLVSGGHTMLVRITGWGRYDTIGGTLDDAVGEAFDKVAKLLGLGYPGGPVLSRLAVDGDPQAIPFPRPMLRTDDLNVSLSGLKTAVIQYVERERTAGRPLRIPDIAASFQAAVTDVQVAKTVRAVNEYGARAVVLAGGVAANPFLRERLRVALDDMGVTLSVPPLDLCTDNAAMIAAAAHDAIAAGRFLGLAADATPDLRLGNTV